MPNLDCDPADLHALITYLRDIGRHELLSTEEVTTHAFWIEAGLLAADRLKTLTDRPTTDLITDLRKSSYWANKPAKR